jgi:hypothetical protein
MVHYTLEQHVFLYDTYMKYGSVGTCWWKFQRKFHDERVPSRQTIHNMVNKLRTTGLLIDKIKNISAECYWGEVRWHRGQTWTYALENGVSKSSARTATQLLKPSSESWCLVCCKCKKDCCMCVFKWNNQLQKIFMCIGTAFLTPPVICEQKNFPPFQMLSARWVMDKIYMCFAASGALVSADLWMCQVY